MTVFESLPKDKAQGAQNDALLGYAADRAMLDTWTPSKGAKLDTPKSGLVPPSNKLVDKLKQSNQKPVVHKTNKGIGL
jgi:hypothetical protein